MAWINNIPAVIQIMDWHLTRTSHYLNQCWSGSLTHICGTWGRWVKHSMNLGFILRTYSINISGNPRAIPASFQVGHAQILNGMRKISGGKNEMFVQTCKSIAYTLNFFALFLYCINLYYMSKWIVKQTDISLSSIGLQLILTICCACFFLWYLMHIYIHICVAIVGKVFRMM